MRKIFSIVTVFFIAFSSCKKNDLGKQQVEKNQNSLIQEAKLFFQEKLISNNTSASDPLSQIEKTPLWDKASISKQSSIEFVVVPLKFSKAINITSNVNANATFSAERQMKLIMHKDLTGGFNANIYTFISDDSKIIESGKFFGIVSIEEWKGGNARNLYYKNGKYKILKTGADKTSSSIGPITTINQRGVDCYVRNYFSCDVDDFGNRSNCQYIGSVFLGCFWQDTGAETDWIDPYDAAGSPQVYNEEQYSVTSVEVQDGVAQITNGSEEVDQNTGLITMNVGYKWKCGKGSTLVLGSLYNWEYYSYETGVVEKVNATDTWKFQLPNGLTHSSIQLIGQTPPTYEYTYALGYAVPNILSGRRTARMEIEFAVYERIAGLTQTKSWTVPAKTNCLAP